MRTLNHDSHSKDRPGERVRAALREVVSIFRDPFGPALEVAGMPGVRIPTRDIEWPGPQKPTIMRFDTANAPPKDSPGYQISHWKPLSVYTQGTSPEGPKRYLTVPDTQNEITRILKQLTSTHEYLTYEAASLLRTDPQIAAYTAHLVVGAGAEDFIFSPGETLDNVCLTDPAVMRTKNGELKKVLDEMQHRTTFFGALFHVISKLAKAFTGGKVENDALNRPYFAHFYDPTMDDPECGLSIIGGELRFQSALTRIKLYWNLASEYYRAGDIPNAFTALGHMMHLVEDLHVPAHVHNDTHGPGNLDSLEGWMTKADYKKSPFRVGNEPNVRIWNGKPLTPPVADITWVPGSTELKITQFVNGIVANTQRFRSVDAEGTDPDQKKTGKLTPDECYAQGSVLIPVAIVDAAQLVVNFLEYHRKYHPLAPVPSPPTAVV
ncbi:Uncharacterised protein [Candidatus Bilamarchaeum dharawalense]|uniref:Uncharacterized protein n=1 Tax=Candidatus Bilamarchaeum dharawalense TaxID=2885759 RepID=A0A5E4LTZ9_9ARCH|nr:Uncharacterised protein [Candidatus Bilamarchaeum dharawalense]